MTDRRQSKLATNAKDKAWSLLRRGKERAALSAFESALSHQAFDPTARRKAAELCTRLGELQRARDHYLTLAALFRDNGEKAKADAVGRIAIELDPQTPAAAPAPLQRSVRQPDTGIYRSVA